MEAESLLTKSLSTVSQGASKTHLEEVFDRLMHENSAALFRLAAGFTTTPADRDDLFQEMVLALWQSLPNFRGESSARTYLFRIARNRAVTYLVTRRTPQTTDAEEILIQDPRPDPERQFADGQQRRLLLNAVRKLPFGYRDVITLALEGLSYSEMAEVLGISEANVGIRLNRAKSALRELLEKAK